MLPRIGEIGIPAIGFGTGTKWFKYGNDTVDDNLISTLVKAVDSGLVHIDGAEVYNTDLEIGSVVEKCKVNDNRDKFWITNKYFAGDSTYKARSKEANPYEALKVALIKNKLKYVDLYLLHAPFIKRDVHGFDLKGAWKFMEQIQKEGLAKNIGVSNFAVEHLKEVIDGADIKPVVNQIEFNAFLQDQTPGIVQYCKANKILIEAYSPLAPLYKGDPSVKASSELNKFVDELAQKYGKTSCQILLKWVLELGIVPITTTSKESRMKEYVDIFDFQLTGNEVEEITRIGSTHPPLRQYWTNDFS